MNAFGIIPFWFQLTNFWPLVFVAFGLCFILKSTRKSDWEKWNGEQFGQSENTPPVQQTDLENNDSLTKKDI